MTLSSITTCVLILLLILCATVTTQGKDGIIELINKNKIHCVSENIKNSNLIDLAMFTSPPLNKTQPAENLLQTGVWENDDSWIRKDSSHMVADVKDRRWEDFEVIQFGYYRFTNLNTSISFSVYGVQNIEFLANNEESLDYFTTHINNTLEWTTFTIFMKNNYMFYYINHKDCIRSYALRPMQIVIKTLQDAYLKIHNYIYKEATNVTTGNPTSLTIGQFEKSSLVLYVSLCKSCILEVKSSYNLTITSSITENSVFEQWQTYKIILNSTKRNKVEFVRKQNNETEKGYWKLDVRLYDNALNKAAYNISSNVTETYTCNYLSTLTNSKQNKRKRHSDSIENPADFPNCDPGMVGSNCEISCRSVLGQKYDLCQQHKICLNSINCECAWGYYGPWCEHECENGKWGLDCQSECYGCQICDKKTGKCPSSNIGSTWSWLWIVLLCVVLGISSFLFGKSFRKRSTAPHTSMVTQAEHSLLA